eukprot:CAMPEP_0175619864 /NCGR_PEP_ID=MMETSP0096-20121207/67629_1 /TAXON_ID=311494 /ORGANISM="Alexandrium monilatum, Strain CCMP3105" /LENGTH=51 /DNA_ID=CAMNT_0016925095 /DNA_START=41 /DNA_END=193 /DNA_ORIENTATION=+
MIAGLVNCAANSPVRSEGSKAPWTDVPCWAGARGAAADAPLQDAPVIGLRA